MKQITQIFRVFVFLILGLLGMAMAFLFMASSAIAIAVLYVVARIRGRPFGVRAYWAQRQASRGSYFYGNGHNRHADPDVIDVEAREIP